MKNAAGTTHAIAMTTHAIPKCLAIVAPFPRNHSRQYPGAKRWKQALKVSHNTL